MQFGFVHQWPVYTLLHLSLSLSLFHLTVSVSWQLQFQLLVSRGSWEELYHTRQVTGLAGTHSELQMGPSPKQIEQVRWDLPVTILPSLHFDQRPSQQLLILWNIREFLRSKKDTTDEFIASFYTIHWFLIVVLFLANGMFLYTTWNGIFPQLSGVFTCAWIIILLLPSVDKEQEQYVNGKTLWQPPYIQLIKKLL